MSTRNNRSDIHRKRHLRKREWRQSIEKQVKEELAKAAQMQPEAAVTPAATATQPA